MGRTKYAGVTLDFYDDKGAFIKECFPEADKLPDVIKTANVKPQESVPDEQFALVAQNNGHILRKYACTDPGTTSMSVMYFLKHAEKLPEEAVKVAADNLFEACIRHNILPPEPLIKLAAEFGASTQQATNVVNNAVSTTHSAVPGSDTSAVKPPAPEAAPKPEGISKSSADEKLAALFGKPKKLSASEIKRLAKKGKKEKGDPEWHLTSEEAGGLSKTAGVIDITGKSPPSRFEELPQFDEDYAVITDDGKRMYPINDWDHIKQACDYWTQESRRMAPEIRRQFATKVASKALSMGYPIQDPTLLDIGSPNYADNGHIRASLEMRKVAMPGPDNKLHREFLDDLMDKTASLNPEVFAECVRRFDVMHQLDGGWDHLVPSPWESTFGLQKIAKVVWESGADRITDFDLNNLVRNHSGELQEEWHHNLAQAMVKDPVGTFNSLPLPQKKIMARLANDKASQGGSVMASENDVSP